MEETKHLSQGSTQPALQQGSLRIYSMRLCPYAQRALLVAEAKRITYDVVNVNLSTKPDWFLALNPRGQVPTLELQDGSALPESTIICDYLEHAHPERPLYPDAPILRARDRLLIETFNQVIGLFYKVVFAFGKADQDVSVVEKLFNELENFEKELVTRGTSFFGGKLPGMVDYMIWPWIEREGLLLSSTNEKLDIFKGRFPKLGAWRESMTFDPAVRKWLLTTEQHMQYLKSRMAGSADYDFLVENE